MSKPTIETTKSRGVRTIRDMKVVQGYCWSYCFISLHREILLANKIKQKTHWNLKFLSCIYDRTILHLKLELLSYTLLQHQIVSFVISKANAKNANSMYLICHLICSSCLCIMINVQMACLLVLFLIRVGVPSFWFKLRIDVNNTKHGNMVDFL